MTSAPSPKLPDDDVRASNALALRAVAFAALFAVIVFGVDRLADWGARRGLQLLPHVPARELGRLRAAHGHTAFLGDSTVIYVPRRGHATAATEVGTLPLYRLLAERLDSEVPYLARPARAPHHLAAELDFLRESGTRPTAIVVAVNLRSLAPDRQLRPGVHDGALVAMLRSGLTLPVRGVSVLQYRFGADSPDEYAQRRFRLPDGSSAGVVEVDQPEGPPDSWSDEVVRRRFLLRYAAPWREPEQLLRLVDALTRIGAETDIPVVVYLTPLPLERYDRLLTDQDRAAIDTNLDALRAVLDVPGTVGLDLSRSLGPDDFVDAWHTPGEHMTHDARQQVTDRLVDALGRARELRRRP